MIIAYLVNQYPSVSHTFIRREIEAMEQQGMTVRRFTIRRARAELVDPADVREASITTCLLEARGRLLVTFAVLAALHPIRFARALLAAMRLARAGGAGRGRHLIYLAEAARMAWICQRQGITHLHAHFGTNPAAVALLCELLGGPQWSFTIHGPDEFDHPTELSLMRKISHSVFAVAISEFGRSQLLRWASPEDWHKVRIVRCGVDASLLEAPAVPFPPSRSLVCVGRLCDQKGHLILLDAMDRLRRKCPDVSLTLAGDGPLRPMLEQRVADLDLAAHVRFAGSCDGARVRQLIQAARVMVLPSFAEGLPVVLMEAFALGRPVISTYVAGIPELVEPDRNGWLVPAGSADRLAATMAEALDCDEQQLQRMALHGNAVVKLRHDVSIETRKLAHLFRSVAAEPAIGSQRSRAHVSLGHFDAPADADAAVAATPSALSH
jgi:glycosyltransferase involved in cell wall biosynthesis